MPRDRIGRRRSVKRFRPTPEGLEARSLPSTLPPGFSDSRVTSGLTQPTSMAFAPDGRIFITEQGGSIRIVQDGALLPSPFLDLNVDFEGERGLLGIALDPNFPSSPYVYVYYTVPGSPAHNRISRFTADGNGAVPGSEVDLFDLDPLSSATNHNGGSLHFGLDGKLYIGVGENANPSNSQSLGTDLGKMLRINPDGTIPTDNPFYAVTTGNNRAIWALGLRNPFTFAVQPGTGRIFINDVGASTWEEIDDGIAGSNYGWPITEGPTNDPRFRGPLFAYGHGPGPTTGSAIVGGSFYNPVVDQFPGNFVGEYFFSDLTNGWIRVFDPKTGQALPFASGLPVATVDLAVDANGSLYYLSQDGGPGEGILDRIDFKPPTPPLNLGLFRPSTAQTMQLFATGGARYAQLGPSSAIAVPADYDGDGKVDQAVFDPTTATWSILFSTGGGLVQQFGPPGSIPVPGDYDGLGHAELAVFDPTTATFSIRRSAAGGRLVQLGPPGQSLPVPADYDGDGRTDLAVFAASTATWSIQFSSGGGLVRQFGQGGVVRPIPADYDGDGHADLAVYNPQTSTWAIQQSHLGGRIVQFGAPGDIPVPMDYDGDGRIDLGVYQPDGGIWSMLQSTAGGRVVVFGQPGDLPLFAPIAFRDPVGLIQVASAGPPRPPTTPVAALVAAATIEPLADFAHRKKGA